MKKLVSILFLAAMFLTGCSTTTEEPKVAEPVAEVEHTRYVDHGRYYLEGKVITDDGNIWSYSQDIISDKDSYDAEPVYIGFDDNGTPDTIEDDIILGLVFDRETAIYDALEESLSESFELERDGNNIHISNMKEEE